jgi:hypothetical protein
MSALVNAGDGAVMKMTAIQRYLFGFLAIVGLLATSAHASDTKATERGSAGRGDGETTVLLRAGGVVGKPQLIRPDGSRVQLSVGGYLSPGMAVETGEGEDLAVAIAPSRSTAIEQADLLVLGPQTRVRFEPASAAEDEAEAKPVVEAIVERGTVRALTRRAEAACAFALRMGERTLSLDGSDLIATFDPDRDDLSLHLHSGSLVMTDGDRKIRLRGGMMRTIEEGRILGAREMEPSTWEATVPLAAVPGVDMMQVVVATVASRDESASGEKGGEATSIATGQANRKKPVITRTGDENKPAVRQPDESETAARESQQAQQQTPPDAGRRLPTIATQKPGTTKREIVEDYVYVRMTTTKGDIVLELDRGRAPITVENFLSYLKTGFYEGTIFHRVINNFMIQAGGYDTEWEKKETGPPIKSEWPTGPAEHAGLGDLPVLHQREGQRVPGQPAGDGRVHGVRQGDRRHGRGRRDSERAGHAEPPQSAGEGRAGRADRD